VNDFLIEQGVHSTHILNAISPAWTSAFPFSRHVCDNYIT
jgi:L-2-hydroxyglutarate oxidase